MALGADYEPAYSNATDTYVPGYPSKYIPAFWHGPDFVTANAPTHVRIREQPSPPGGDRQVFVGQVVAPGPDGRAAGGGALPNVYNIVNPVGKFWHPATLIGEKVVAPPSNT